MSGRKGHGRHRRIPEGERYQLPCFQKVWKKCFLTHHDLPGKDDIAAVEARRSLGCVEDELTSFLDISDGSGSPCEADEVKWYCEGRTSLEKVQRGIGEAATIVAVWIDDRNSPHLNGAGRVRLCQKLLTPQGLYRYLQQPRYKYNNEADAERRLIHISDLTPDMIMALAATAPYLQAPALRDAICKHIAFRPSVRVHVPSDGMPTFQMEFHLPFFALRKRPTSGASTWRIREKRLRDFEELTLLTREKVESDGHENYCLYEMHMGCVTHGFDEWNWNNWTMEDYVQEYEEGGDEHNGGEVGTVEAVAGHDISEDPIACGLDANKPIWRPRQYFLKALEIRIKKIRQEWDELVHKLEIDRKEYKRLHSFTSSKSSRNPKGRAEEMSSSFHWTRQRMELLTKLLGVLSGTIQEWNTFISMDGDVAYFSEISTLDDFERNSLEIHHSDRAGQSLRSIKEAFDRLENDRQRLILLSESLYSDFSTLKLLLSLEGNDATANSAFLSKFTVWVLFPWTLASGMFSMQPTVIPFELTPRWFLFTVFLLIMAMFIIHQLMMRWSSWRNDFFLWMKMKRFAEEEAIPGVRNVYHDDIIRAGSDIESLAMQVLPRRRDVN